jgi:hypothetical protein
MNKALGKLQEWEPSEKVGNLPEPSRAGRMDGDMMERRMGGDISDRGRQMKKPGDRRTLCLDPDELSSSRPRP